MAASSRRFFDMAREARAGGFGDQGARHGNTLALAGEFGGVVLDALRQPDLFQHGGGFGVSLFVLHAANQERHGNVFQRGEFGAFRSHKWHCFDGARRFTGNWRRFW